MTNKIQYQYVDKNLENIESMIAAFRESAIDSNGIFDSAASTNVLSNIQSQHHNFSLPNELQAIFDELPGRGAEHQHACNRVIGALLDSIQDYEKDHRVNIPSDLINQAIHNAYSTTRHGLKSFKFDAAVSSLTSDPQGLQPNRAVVAIYSTINEAIPFAHYLPADIGSNKAILAIVNHKAGKTYGSYAQNAVLDGIYGGDRIISAARIHKCLDPESDGTYTGKLTVIQQTSNTCDQAATGVKTLRGRGVVYVNGLPCAKEISSSGSGASTVAGSVTVSGTTYQIGGTINTDTGVISITTTPSLPNTNELLVESFVDYERQPELVPTIIAAVETFEIYASPYRVNTYHGIDSRTQMQNELGLDPYAESIMMIQSQYGLERHFDVLRKARRIANRSTVTHNLDISNRSTLTRQQLWGEFPATLGYLSQQMVQDTMNHGITHLYVGKLLAAQLRLLPNDIFEPSGIPDRPGIYRIGRLVNQYEVYCEPNKVLTENIGAGTGEILAVGRATDVTRNPFILGDAVAPIVQPLAINGDLNMGAGFYARNFTEINPHMPSALGCALINVTGLF